MRTFILKASKTHTTSKFNIEDLPGAGRLDNAIKCISSAIWLSYKLRDAELYIIMEGQPNPPLTMKWSSKIVRVSPDERSIGLWIKKALEAYEQNKKANPGIEIEKKSFRDLMESMSGRPMYVLDESGKDIGKTNFKDNPVIILGDHIGLMQQDVEFLESLGAQRISLGTKSYLASQCIDYINIELDRRQM